MIKGTLKADGIVVSQIVLDFLKSPTELKARAGLVHQQSGATLAWTEATALAWSTETLEQIGRLRDSMEADLARSLFVDGASRATDTSPDTAPRTAGGLGEHLGIKVDAEQL